MGKQKIGSIIECERKKQKISQKKLAKGIFTHQQLSLLEGNCFDTDKLIVDILLQRLGKSPDKLEIIMPINEYNKIRTRDMIFTLVFKHKYEKAINLLEKYYEYNGSVIVHQMFYNRTMAYIYEQQCDYINAHLYICRALDLTLPNWDKTPFNTYLISTFELENILLYIKILKEQKQITQAIKYLNDCLDYINKHFSDKEERAKIFPKCVWLMSQIYTDTKYDAYIIDLCNEALELLRKENMSNYLLPLLSQYIMRCNRIGHLDIAAEYQKYYDVYANTFKNYGSNVVVDSLFFNAYQGEYHLENEILRGQRIAKGMAQQNVWAGVFTNKVSISMIENGKKIARKNNLEKLFSAVDVDKQRFNVILATDSFEVLDLKDDIDFYQSTNNTEKVKETIDLLRKKLDTRIAENDDYIRNIELFNRLKAGEVDSEHALNILNDMLIKTYSLDVPVHRAPFRNEVLIINQICYCMFELNRQDDAINILEKILKRFEKCKVNTKYNVRSYMLLYANYVRYIGENGNREYIDKAISLSHIGIKKELEAGKITLLAYLYTIIGCSMIDLGIKTEECKAFIKSAFFLNRFNYNEPDCQSIEAYYKEIFNEDIE